MAERKIIRHPFKLLSITQWVLSLFALSLLSSVILPNCQPDYPSTDIAVSRVYSFVCHLHRFFIAVVLSDRYCIYPACVFTSFFSVKAS